MNFDYLLRRFLGRATCLLSPGAKLTRLARIRNICGNSSLICIGSKTLISGELLIFPQGEGIKIGEWGYLGENSRIWSAASVLIGDRVLISHDVNIFDSLTHPLNPYDRHNQYRSIIESGHPNNIKLDGRPIVIEDDVWIAAGAIILRGVNIGKGAIVGAGAVVTSDIPPFTIVAGNPARVIRKLTVDERLPFSDGLQ